MEKYIKGNLKLMMHYGLIELHLKILWECLLIKWSMEKLVIYQIGRAHV